MSLPTTASTVVMPRRHDCHDVAMPQETVRLQLPLALVEKIIARERLSEAEVSYLKARLLTLEAGKMMARQSLKHQPQAAKGV